MKIKVKNITELLNVLYGDNESYSYIDKKGLKAIIKDHKKSLSRIYEILEEITKDTTTNIKEVNNG